MYKALDKWLPAWLRQPPRPAFDGVTHLLLCVCDHFEPLHATDQAGALARLSEWRRRFPELARAFADADGVGPRHTFFYPIEQYDPELLEPLAALCRETGAETEIHLHHDRDTAEGLRDKIERGKKQLADHGLLSRDPAGALRYGFIHGDWALDNAHPQGRHCGVRNELAVLGDTGCYADFTMPSLPSPTQARLINRLYYARGTDQPRSFDRGEPVIVSPKMPTTRPVAGELLLVQGPTGLNWEWRKWGLLPRIENGDLTGANPPRLHRLRVWEKCNIQVQGRPDWLFIKLHTHGGIPQNYQMLLGEPMREFHAQLREYCASGRYRLHYVTAREMVNILHAAEAGLAGSPGEHRNYRYPRPAGLSA